MPNENEIKEYVYNPTSEDFTTTYDINADNKPIPFTVPAGEYAEFPRVIANHLKKHLATKILNIRGIRNNWEDDYKAVIKEISL